MQAMVPMILECPGMIFGLEKGWSSISKNYVLRFQKLYARIRKSVKDKSPQQCKFQICDSWISRPVLTGKKRWLCIYLLLILHQRLQTGWLSFIYSTPNHGSGTTPDRASIPGRSAMTKVVICHPWYAPDPIHVIILPACFFSACGVVGHGFFNCPGLTLLKDNGTFHWKLWPQSTNKPLWPVFDHRFLWKVH